MYTHPVESLTNGRNIVFYSLLCIWIVTIGTRCFKYYAPVDLNLLLAQLTRQMKKWNLTALADKEDTPMSNQIETLTSESAVSKSSTNVSVDLSLILLDEENKLKRASVLDNTPHAGKLMDNLYLYTDTDPFPNGNSISRLEADNSQKELYITQTQPLHQRIVTMSKLRILPTNQTRSLIKRKAPSRAYRSLVVVLFTDSWRCSSSNDSLRA